jgi:fatty-acyl-CoA synthase
MTAMRQALAFADLGAGRTSQSGAAEFGEIRPRLQPTPTRSSRLKLRIGGFATLIDALEYAARGETGFNFYSGRGELIETLSYARLRDRAEAVARRLLWLGLTRGDRIALAAETNADFLAFFFGCQYAGLVPVPLPLPTGLGARQGYVQQLRRQIGGAGAKVAVGSPEIVSYLEAASEGLDLQHVGNPAFFDSLPEGTGALEPLGAGELSYLQYSSGSTRFPLGVAVPMPALMSNADHNVRHGLRVRREDRSASWLPLYHDMGLVGFVVAPLITQSSADLLPSQDFARRPLVWLDIIGRNRATVSYSPSFGYEICVRRAERVSDLSLDLSAWRAAGIGGDMIRPEVLERFSRTFAQKGFRRTAFLASYGLAENTLAVSFAPLDRGIEVDVVDRRRLAEDKIAVPVGPAEGDASDRRAFARCGRPLPSHQAEIRDEDGRPLPDRRVGRIFIKGPSLMAGYFDQPEATAQVITPDGWLDTGDMGYTIKGELVITGRSKDLIIVNGRNIWPQDIEWAVEQLAGLRSGDVAAFSLDEERGSESVVVLVHCRIADEGEIRSLVREIKGVVNRTAAVDCEVVPVPPRSLPQTSSGKLSRSKAKQNFLAGLLIPPARLKHTVAAE